MPNRIKHKAETRKRIYDLYWTGRREKGKHGRYTVKQIEQMTGVPESTAGKIARGEL